MPGNFGILKKVPLRRLWPNEALDFTPWLAQNLDALGEILGMDLELQGLESAVGTFSLDLLAHDLGTDSIVIIENQIEQTNHDHLGKLMTYAAGHDAAVAVWIAADFRDEHRQALDWLNQRTDASTRFFGVVVEALQIDNSNPACNLRLVAFPNDWRKTTISTTPSKPSPRGEAYQHFFQRLIDLLRTKYNFTKARKGQAQSWYTFASGYGGLGYSLSFASGNRVRAELYIDRQDANWNKWLFDSLYAQKTAIEQQFGNSLEWERLDDKQASRIAFYRQASIEDPPEVLNDVLMWSAKHLLLLKKVFSPHLSPLSTSGPNSPETSVSPEDGLQR